MIVTQHFESNCVDGDWPPMPHLPGKPACTFLDALDWTLIANNMPEWEVFIRLHPDAQAEYIPYDAHNEDMNGAPGLMFISFCDPSEVNQ